MSAYLCELASSRFADKGLFICTESSAAFIGLVCANSTYELNSFKIPIAVLFATCPGVTSVQFMCAAFKFGRRVHFALRRKMLKPPIARLPAI